MRLKDSNRMHNFTPFIHHLQMLQNDSCPYTLLEVGRPDVSWSIKDEDVSRIQMSRSTYLIFVKFTAENFLYKKYQASRSREADNLDKVSSKYFTPFNHRLMQSSFDLCQVIFANVKQWICSHSVLSVKL